MRVNDSQAYRKMDVTRERISRILIRKNKRRAYVLVHPFLTVQAQSTAEVVSERQTVNQVTSQNVLLTSMERDGRETKLNEAGRQKLRRRNFSQDARRANPYSGLLQA